MSNYTEADVTQWFMDVDHMLARHGFTMAGTIRAELPAMRTVALEGAKVPGLVALLDAFEVPPVIGQDPLTARVELLAQMHRAAIAQRDTARREVSALQARVADMEHQVRSIADKYKRDVANFQEKVQALEDKRDEVVSERDALRAQVTATDERARHDGDLVQRFREAAKAGGPIAGMRAAVWHAVYGDALSAPPAETTLLLCPKCDQRHPGPTNPCVLCQAHEAYRAEQSARDDAEMAASAETAPAPERPDSGPLGAWCTWREPCGKCDVCNLMLGRKE